MKHNRRMIPGLRQVWFRTVIHLSAKGKTMDSVWETYKGKRYFFAHYDHKTAEQFKKEVAEVEAVIHGQPKGSLLLLMDTTGVIHTPEILNISKDTALASRPYLKKAAMVGMTGARRALLDIVLKFAAVNVSAFETVEQAKEWLAAD